MSQYKKLCDGLQKLLIFVVAIFASVMIIITTVEVVRRYIFSASFQWAEELSRYLMVSLAFLGGAVAYRNKNLIPLDLITNMLSKKIQLYLGFVLEIISVIILALLFYLSMKEVMSPVVYRQISIGLPISMAIPFASMPIGFGCMLIFAVEHFNDIIKSFKEVK
ncbi:MAG: TRAP transporter small permease [Sedimentibacter sp.]